MIVDDRRKNRDDEGIEVIHGSQYAEEDSELEWYEKPLIGSK